MKNFSLLLQFIVVACLSVAITPFAAAAPTLPPVWQNATPTGRFDARARVSVAPVRIVWQQNADLISGSDLLLQQGNGQADLQNARICVLRSDKGRHASLLLDFGRELQGGLRLVTGMPEEHAPVHVRVRFGESVSEAMCEIDGVNGASNDHAVRDFTLAVPWLGTVECGSSGFRFARIDLLDDDRELHLKQIEAVFEYRDIPYLGSFRCDDERLNQIWMTGAYTVHLNMQEYLWDGVKRDRLVWVGDLHPEIMTVSSVFGYNEVVPRSLDLVRDTTPLPAWMNGISSYSLWWIIIQRDWYLHQGDKRYLQEQQVYLQGLLRLLFTRIGDDGREQLDGMRFLDWPSSDDAGSVAAGLQSLTILALDAGAELSDYLDDTQLSADCRRHAARMRQCVVADGGKAKQGQAMMVLAGIADAAKTDREVLSVGGSAGFSTFYGYYMLRAMAAAGNYEGALARIREFWGAMLDLGATTFWEDFNMEWLPAARIDAPVPAGMRDLHRECGAYCYKGFRHSLCHGWASGPTAWLSEYVLGVQVVEAGCRTLRIEPHLGDLQWVEGTFPTPRGVVKIRHERTANGDIRSEIKAPKGVKIELVK
ncbi:MAG: alpha-L-rhamnosidase C-terminal domain-containing protein [Alistipes sp.]